MDNEMRDRNRQAWNAGRYDAWVEGKDGPPEDQARVLIADPRHKLRRLLPYLGDVAGKRFCNVQGSNGCVAVALALLGGEATVLDFAEQNQRYALELAAAAGVSIDYRLGDVMDAVSLDLAPFDWLVAEGGILHYHSDLTAFFSVLARLARRDGRLLLEDFHPVARKLFQPGGAADYFHAELSEWAVPDSTGAGRNLGTCILRNWTLGEIVTAAVDGGWRIERLDERPGFWTEPTIPGMFTLVATKA